METRWQHSTPGPHDKAHGGRSLVLVECDRACRVQLSVHSHVLHYQLAPHAPHPWLQEQWLPCAVEQQLPVVVAELVQARVPDLQVFADTLGALLADPARMKALGEAAQRRVVDHFLGVDHLLKYAQLIEQLDDA